MKFKVRPVTESDRAWVNQVYRGWGADFVVTRGRKVYPDDTEGFLAEDANGNKIGLVTYEIVGKQCEIVTLDAFVKFKGIGTALMNQAVQTVREQKCERVWLITTNDNLDAIRFYHKRGFVIAAVHVNALAHSRKLKPSIPEIGNFGIPLRDEIEFEMLL